MVVVFAFATLTPINAKNVNKDLKLGSVDCVAAAFYYQSYLESLGMGKEAANAAADFHYTECMQNQQ